MADDDAPSWLQENPLARPHSSSGPSPVAKKSGGLFSSSTRQSTPAPAPTPQVVQHVVEVKAAEADPPYKWLVRIIMTVINLGLGIMVAATGALGLKESSSVDDTGIVFVGIYLLIFATILFIYEFVQIYPCQFCDLPLKRNFGFLYGTNGKGLYMVFMGILAFGLSKPRQLAIATGVVVSFWGVMQCILYLWRPLYFDKKEKYIP